MKIVVIGGTGLIGRQLVGRLVGLGHEVVAASPQTGVNSVTGEGLAEALAGATVVVDVTNAPSFENEAVLAFFRTSSENLLAVATVADVQHYVSLSVVGCDRWKGEGYFRAKRRQELLVRASAVPFTIVRATQFFEFMGAVADAGAQSDGVHLSTGAIQPIASADVALALADVVLSAPRDGVLEIAGPERAPLADFVTAQLRERTDPRAVIRRSAAPYFGMVLDDRSLTPSSEARIMSTRFQNWLHDDAEIRSAA